MPIGTAVPRAHLRALREPELPRVVGLLRRQRVRDASRARIQRHPQRRGADRRLAAVQVPGHRAVTRRASSIASSRATSAKMAAGQVVYTPWCDEHGQVIDDGTVTRLDETRVPLDGGRSEPALVPAERRRPRRARRGRLRARSRRWRCRGRRRRACLRASPEADIGGLKYFRITQRHASPASRWTSRARATPAISATRSGCRRERALDGLGRADGGGRAYDISPPACWRSTSRAIEAGLLLIDVDFISSTQGADRGADVHAVRDGTRPARRPRQGAVRRTRRAGARTRRRPAAADRRSRRSTGTTSSAATSGRAAAGRRAPRPRAPPCRSSRGSQVGTATTRRPGRRC